MTPEEVMRTVTKGIATNDIRPLLAAIDDNTIWKTASSADGPFRFGGEYRTRAGVADVTSNIFTTYTFLKFDNREIVSAGEVAWGLFDVACMYHPSKTSAHKDKLIHYEFALRLHVRDDKILEWRGFFDTLSLLYQQGEYSPQIRD